MSNPIMPQSNRMNISDMARKIKENPMQFMIEQKFQIPNGINNNPQAIIQHLLNSGQINQQQVNQAAQMLPQLQNLLGK